MILQKIHFCLFQVDKIINHKINVFINRQLIYNYPEQLFADAGIMAIEHADFEVNFVYIIFKFAKRTFTLKITVSMSIIFDSFTPK